MGKSIRFVVAIALSVTLGACQTTTGSGAHETEPNENAPVGEIGPGAAPLSIKTSTFLFQEVCVKTVRNNSGFRKALANNGFVASPTTGTYYDNKRDVSFKWITTSGKPVCSMAFVSKEKPVELGMALALGSLPPNSKEVELFIEANSVSTKAKSRNNSIMTFTPAARVKGEQYYRATIAAN